MGASQAVTGEAEGEEDAAEDEADARDDGSGAWYLRAVSLLLFVAATLSGSNIGVMHEFRLPSAVPELPGPADAGEPPATAPEGEDGGDMELAWQMLETSRVIFSNMSGA